ncbi:hypothetical protein ZWY2020_051945 [Hordeum vulgare]|nr:hypothetical protein ZWY2020_051945 [Hordeum vulgare]
MAVWTTLCPGSRGQLIYDVFDYLHEHAKSSTMCGFKGGPASVMKGNYAELTTDFVHLQNQETGMGWDPVKQTVTASAERWKNLKKKYQGCGRFQKAGLQNEDLLAKIFEDLRNTAEDHWPPANGSMPQSPQNVDAEDHGDENEDKESEEEDESPVINNKGKRVGGVTEGKGKKIKEWFYDHAIPFERNY